MKSKRKPIQRQRCINYKEVEAPFFTKIEDRMCLEYGMSISQLHKEAIRQMWNSNFERPKNSLGFIMNEESKEKIQDYTLYED